MWFFSLFSSVSLYLGLAFCALCLATGLFYLSELAEEYTVRTKFVLRSLIFSVCVIHMLLWLLDEFPFWPIMFGIAAHVCYGLLLSNFPIVSLKSVAFILSCVGFIVTHIIWYRYFTDFFTPMHDFHQLLGFFFTCVWIVPGGFFITLSFSDLSLPGLDHSAGSGSGMAMHHGSDQQSKKSRRSVFSWIMGCMRAQKGESSSSSSNKMF